MALGFARINHVWNNPSRGTGPFVTGLWMAAPDGADEGDFLGVMDTVQGAWNDELASEFSDDLGDGLLIGQYIEGSTVFDEQLDLADAEDTGGNFGAGYSVRVILGGARPAGGRPNQMYWPLLGEGAYSAPGVPAGVVQAAFQGWFNVIDLATQEGAFTWANRHFVDHDEHAASWSRVTGVTVAATSSWLQKRYR